MEVESLNINRDIDITNSEPRIQSSTRMQYEAQVQVIKNQIGTLDDVRNKLGLSQRKICQLLLVDPSAWTRWTKGAQESAPPHIWRSLQWYLIINQKIPGLTPEYFLGTRHATQMRDNSDIQELKALLENNFKEIRSLKDRIQKLKTYFALSLTGFLCPWIYLLGRYLFFKYIN